MKSLFKPKIILALGSILVVFAIAVPFTTQAQVEQPQVSDYGLRDFGEVGIGQDTDLQEVIANIVDNPIVRRPAILPHFKNSSLPIRRCSANIPPRNIIKKKAVNTEGKNIGT